MKLIKNTIYALSMLSVMGLWSCANDDLVSVEEISTTGIPVTVTVGRGEPSTRTIISENTSEGGLNDVWATGDKLEVYYADGDKAGQKAATLELISGANQSKGVFKGTIETPSTSGNYRLWYFGQPNSDGELPKLNFKPNEDNNRIALDMSNTAFKSAAELASLDILTKAVELSVENGDYSFVSEDNSITMEAFLAMARFSFSGVLPQNVKGYVTICNKETKQPDMDRYAEFDPATGDTYYYQYNTPKYCVLDDVNSSDDIYIAFLKGTYKLSFTFVTEEGKVYRHTFNTPTQLEKGKYYSNFVEATEDETEGTHSGIQIPFVEEGENYYNPGDMNNWGVAENLMPYNREMTTSPVREDTADGWTVNTSMWTNGGFGPWIEYVHNGIAKAGLLFSDDNGTAYYYQWGRWMGFPPSVYNYSVTTGGAWNRFNGQMTAIPGVDYMNDYRRKGVGYIWDNYQYSFFYQSVYVSNLSKIKADRFALIYNKVSNLSNTMDYMQDNADVTWEERSGNPCPDDYRLPTPEELAIFIPAETEVINSQHAEVKVIDGVKYALKWVVNTSTTPVRLEVQSVKVSDNNISITDKVFNEAPVKYLHAMGYLNWDAVLNSKNSMGAYWSNASAKLDDRNAYGGVYLEIDFSGSKATLGLGVTYRSMALTVIPLKDGASKSTSIKPWFPICVN